MKVTLNEEKKELTITLDLETPHPSKSGKTLIIASTYGPQTSAATLDDKAVVISANCYVRK